MQKPPTMPSKERKVLLIFLLLDILIPKVSIKWLRGPIKGNLQFVVSEAGRTKLDPLVAGEKQIRQTRDRWYHATNCDHQ